MNIFSKLLERLFGKPKRNPGRRRLGVEILEGRALLAGDLPLLGEAPPTDQVGLYGSGNFYQDANGNGQWDGASGGDSVHGFGNATDVPVAGD